MCSQRPHKYVCDPLGPIMVALKWHRHICEAFGQTFIIFLINYKKKIVDWHSWLCCKSIISAARSQPGLGIEYIFLGLEMSAMLHTLLANYVTSCYLHVCLLCYVMSSYHGSNSSSYAIYYGTIALTIASRDLFLPNFSHYIIFVTLRANWNNCV